MKKKDLKELEELEEFYKAMEKDLFNDYTAEDLMQMENEFLESEGQKEFIKNSQKDYDFESRKDNEEKEVF